MKEYSYFCSMKRNAVTGTTRLVFLAALLLPSAAFAQNLGVGITYPQATLHVHSNYEIFPLLPEPIDRWGDPEPPIGDEHYYQTTVLFTNEGTGATQSDGFLINQINGDITFSQQETGYFRLQNQGTLLELTSTGVGIGGVYGDYKFSVNGNSHFSQWSVMAKGLRVDSTLRATGNVFITGPISAASALSVAGPLTVGNGFSCDAQGNLRVKHLKVTLTDWPDYVFGGGHTLMPLRELETYIGEHSHLPGVPTAEEVEQEGADLGEMNKVLMEKVEELTLYIIDLQKQIDELKSNR